MAAPWEIQGRDALSSTSSASAQQTGGSLFGGGFNVVYGSGSSISASPIGGAPSWFWPVAAVALVVVALRWKKRS